MRQSLNGLLRRSGVSWWKRVTSVAAVVGIAWLGAGAGRPADPPPVLMGQDRVDWPELHDALAEAAGGQVVEDLALQRALRAEVAARGLKADTAAAEREKQLLLKTLTAAAGRDEGDGPILLEQVRTSRGLGPVRFRALLERNAMLRLLVRADAGGEPAVSQEDLRQAYELKYGPRVRARLILIATEEQAREATDRLAKEPFAEVAGAMSLDPSAARGGLLDPFSIENPDYPVAVRKVLRELEEGRFSPPIAVAWGQSQGFAIMKLEGRVPPTPGAPTLEGAADDLRAEVRMVRERAAMDRLAKRLVAESKVTVFDKSLGWSWDKRTGKENAGAAR
jgi:parvulin-like peptidyl-prolyl isomerase